MNETNPSVTEADLHAYADGQLPETARARIEAFLADNPDEAAMVTEWQAQNGAIRSLFAGYEKAKDSDPLLFAPPRAVSSGPKRWAIAASALLVFTLGAVSGHYGPALLEKPELQLAGSETLPKQAETAFTVYAALRSLGREGLADLVDRCCDLATRFARGVEQLAGCELLNDVVINQVLFRFEDDESTLAILEAVQQSGEAWMGGTSWDGRAAIRVSVSSWRTTEADIDRTVAAFEAALVAA